jgi:hypothetical protein
LYRTRSHLDSIMTSLIIPLNFHDHTKILRKLKGVNRDCLKVADTLSGRGLTTIALGFLDKTLCSSSALEKIVQDHAGIERNRRGSPNMILF